MKIIKLLLGLVFGGTLVLLAVTWLKPMENIQIVNVVSGSMEPAIKVGTILIIKTVPINKIAVGEIVAYEATNGISITHRVVGIKEVEGKTKLFTKGDANETADVDLVDEEKIVGKAIFALPWMGYVSVWTKTPVGFILLVIVPAMVIIGSEIWNIKNEYKKIVIKKFQEGKP